MTSLRRHAHLPIEHESAMDHGLHSLGNVLIVQDKHRRLAAQFEDALLELRNRNACDDAAHPIAAYES
jgi:hypothetical protein